VITQSAANVVENELDTTFSPITPEYKQHKMQNILNIEESKESKEFLIESSKEKSVSGSKNQDELTID